MFRISDWHINATWTVCAIFATGAVWYFASANEWRYVAITAIAAFACAGFAIFLHKKKDAQHDNVDLARAQLDQQTLSKHPTKDNIERIILESNPKDDWISYHDNEKSVFAYAHDVNLRLEMLNDERGVQCEDFREPWANKFPNPRATGYWCCLFYGSTQIDRYILVAVDGARALLPIPRPRFDPRDRSMSQVRAIDYKVALIHDTINMLQQYMARAGLHVAKDTLSR